MTTITRQGHKIIIHRGRRAYISLYQKARSKGYKTCWTNENMICMKKGDKMKVPDRIKSMQKSLKSVNLNIVIIADIQWQLALLEVETADALQIAKEEGFDIGDKSGKKHAEAEAAGGAIQAARYEGYRACYQIGFVEGRIIERG